MKKALLILTLLCVCALSARAQNDVKADMDSTFAHNASVDSTLTGKDIFQVLGGRGGFSREGKIVIDQPQSVSRAMNSHIAGNAHKKISGYRVRIFFDNKQNARTMSEKVAGGFRAQHPGISVYLEYENPYFKVTVGDFRTKNDARRFLNSIKGAYPSGFIVKENINYPIM